MPKTYKLTLEEAVKHIKAERKLTEMAIRRDVKSKEYGDAMWNSGAYAALDYILRSIENGID